MELPTGKQKSYCSRWAGQNKGSGDVAVLSWVQMKKTPRQSENTNRKAGKKIPSGASKCAIWFHWGRSRCSQYFLKNMNLHVAQKDFSEEHNRIYLHLLEIETIWLFYVSTGYMFFFPNKCSIHICSLWCSCLVVVIRCVHPSCPVCCIFLPGAGGCIKGACEHGRRESCAQVGVWMWAHPHTALQVLARRSVWPPTPSCSSPCPGVTQGQNLLCFSATSRVLGVPWIRLGIAPAAPVLGSLCQPTEHSGPELRGSFLFEQSESSDRFLAVWQPPATRGAKSMWWWSAC